MIPLEDNFSDIVAKAARGLKFTDEAIVTRSSVTAKEWSQLKSGHFQADPLRSVAVTLQLAPNALLSLARKEYYPADTGPIPGFAHFNTVFGDMTVNSYLVWCPTSKKAALFDTGADADAALAAVRSHGLSVEFIFLTHTHEDHIADIAKVKAATHAPVLVSELEKMPHTQLLKEGDMFSLGALSIATFLTSGHSVGGLTFVVKGLKKTLAIVGDSLFAGSMGGAKISYEGALKNNREKILSLPDDTVICPGHGPLTTVDEEKRHNPFFALA